MHQRTTDGEASATAARSPGGRRIRHRVPILLALCAAGCTTQVIPSPAPLDPVTVYLTDYGKHSSVVLPAGDGGYDEYAFGDWEYFAKGNTSWPVAMRAILGSPQATLGHRHIDPAAVNVNLAEALGAKRLMSFPASRQRVDALAEQLDARFRSSKDAPYPSDYSSLSHIPDDERYWGGNNCNHLTAAWLRQIGCEIDGPAIFSSFILQPPPDRRKVREATSR